MGGFAYQRKSMQKTCHWIKGSRHAIDGYISIKTEENQATKCRPAILGLQSRYWGKLHVKKIGASRTPSSAINLAGSSPPGEFLIHPGSTAEQYKKNRKKNRASLTIDISVIFLFQFREFRIGNGLAMHKVRKAIAPMAFRILGINSGINRMADFFGQNAFRFGRVTVMNQD